MAQRWHMPGTCMAHAWRTSGPWQDNVWHMSGHLPCTCLAPLWIMLGPRAAHVWQRSGKMYCPCLAHARAMARVRQMCGPFVDHRRDQPQPVAASCDQPRLALVSQLVLFRMVSVKDQEGNPPPRGMAWDLRRMPLGSPRACSVGAQKFPHGAACCTACTGVHACAHRCAHVCMSACLLCCVLAPLPAFLFA